MASSDVIKIEILGTKLQLRGGDDPEAVQRASELVKTQVEDLADRAPTAPSIQLALLAAINIADQALGNHENEEMISRCMKKAKQIDTKIQTAVQ